MIRYLLSIDKKYFKVLFIGWTCTILFLLLREGSLEEPGFFFRIPYFDKVAHFSVFMIWSALFGLSFIRFRDYMFLVGLIFFAGITEYLQQFVINRTSDLFDAIIDVLGGIFGYYLIKYCKKRQ